jgi:UPF0271 protein
MYRTLTLARDRGVTVGAHPSFPDLAGFGRRRLPASPAEIERFTAAQVGALAAIGGLAGHPVRYVKPHGALANLASEDRETATAIVRAVHAVDSALALLAISGTVIEQVARDAAMPVYAEIFADRGYTAAGNLVPRGEPGAMIEAEVAAVRLTAFLASGIMPTAAGGGVALTAHSICVHGDTPGAVTMARCIRRALRDAGVGVRAFLPAA